MANFINFIQTRKKIIIIVLIIIFSIILLMMRFMMKTNLQEPSPLPIAVTLSPEVVVHYSPYPTIPPIIQPRLKYPMKFNSVTVEFRPRSGTFLVYYEGPVDAATKDYFGFMDRLGLKPEDYSVEYRSLEPISLPPAYNRESEN